MAVRTDEEIMKAVQTRIGDDVSDEALAFVQDIRDTLADRKSSSGEDWKAKYEQCDADWRKKYRDAFFNTPSGDPEPDKKDEPEKPLTFENLFK